MKILLIRHGAVQNPDGTNYGTLPGWHLSPQGREQIEQLGISLKAEQLTPCRIIASPLERAQETAAILSQSLDLQIKTDDRLTEWNMGEWMGKPLKYFYETSGYYSPQMVTEGMEPLDQLADRIIAAINDSLHICHGDILICSHREPMAATIIKLQNLPWPKIHQVDMPMGSVWQLDFEDGKFLKAKRIL